MSGKGFRKVYQGDYMIFGDLVTSLISIHNGKSKEYANGSHVILWSRVLMHQIFLLHGITVSA